MAKEYEIGDFLERIKRPISLDPGKEYKLVTIRSKHRGVVLRGLKKGAEIKSKMYQVKTGDFVISGIDARNGAFGIISEELDGAVVTNDFWYFKIDESVIDKHLFLELTATSWFDEICNRGSDGTTHRIRLQKDRFFNQKVWLPEPHEQPALLKLLTAAKQNKIKIEKEISEQKSLITQLKQSILQEAIEGKLTADWRKQNPNVEPASELLIRIKEEKAQLIKEKKIKKEKPLPPITDEEIPFDLPEGWVWCRLGEIYVFIDYRGKTPIKTDHGVRLFTAKNVRFGFLNINPEEFISNEEYETRMTRGFPKKGDLLFTTEAPLGNVALLDSDEMKISTAQRLITFQSPLRSFSNQLNLYFIMARSTQKLLMENSSGVTAKGIKSKRLVNVLLPFPPEQEQDIIIQKVNELMGKVCLLENEINESEQHAKQLMQAVLKEAFETKEETKLEIEG